MTDNLIQSCLERAGIAALKPLQSRCIEHILAASAADSERERRRLVVLPTGYGKTLCYALPALALPGLTLVIYPLRALMHDQTRRFQALGLNCALLIGGREARALAADLARIRAGGVQLALANPEILERPDVLAALGQAELSHVVIDEAHVLHHWGASFRPAYLRLSSNLAALRPRQISAFTATADTPARMAVRELLGPVPVWELRAPVDRPEIRYRLIRSPDPALSLQVLLGTLARPAVVFIQNRAACETLSLRFRHLAAYRESGIRFYHAGLSRAEREHLEHWFFHGKDAVLVSTNAYGMGVDKPDIRSVVHLGLPDKACNYLQESGRAGRDGQAAQAICLVGANEAAPQDPSLADFVAGRECRRRVLLQAVDCALEACAGCDVCDARLASPAPELQALQAFLERNSRQYPLAEAARACHAAGCLGQLSQVQIRALLEKCLEQGLVGKSWSPFSFGCLHPKGSTRDHAGQARGLDPVQSEQGLAKP